MRESIEIKEKKALRQKVDNEEHLNINGGLRDAIIMKIYLHRPMNFAKNVTLECI